METSYNGWTASPNPADFGGLDNTQIAGTDVVFAPGFRAGDVAYVFGRYFAEYHKRIEPLVGGWCWGYNYKRSANSNALISCHASGTAGDANAPRHSNGARGTLSGAQVAELRRIQAEFDHLIYWGGDGWGGGTPDEMHHEIAEGVTAGQVAALAARLRGGPTPPAQPWLSLPSVRSRPLSFQRWYNAYPFSPALLPIISPVANSFGPQSLAALKKVQARYGLVPDGIDGPLTKKVLWDLGWRG